MNTISVGGDRTIPFFISSEAGCGMTEVSWAKVNSGRNIKAKQFSSWPGFCPMKVAYYDSYHTIRIKIL